MEISGATFAAPGTQTAFSVADAAGFETLTWVVAGPGGFTASGDGEQFSFSAPTGGTYTITVTATDPDGETLTATATLTVFGDIAGNQFSDDIVWLAQEGITRGCGDGTNYCPSTPVTRAQMAAFLSRALSLAQTGTDYFDDDNDSIHQDDINRLAAASHHIWLQPGTAPTAPTRPSPAPRWPRSWPEPSASPKPHRPLRRRQRLHPPRRHQPPRSRRHHPRLRRRNRAYCPNRPVTRAQMAAFLHRARHLIATTRTVER